MYPAALLMYFISAAVTLLTSLAEMKKLENWEAKNHEYFPY
jgi:hypothetical protein